MIFVGQTNIEISLSSGVDLTGASAQIVFSKPSGAVIKRAAQIEPGQTGNVTWTGTAGDSIFDESGSWRVWLEITYLDTTKTFSEAKRIHVATPGSV